MISVVVVEDQSLVRDAIATLLSLEDDFTVVATLKNGKDAWQWLETHPSPDIVLSDIEMPEMSGLGLAEKLHHSNLSCTLLFMTTFAKPGYITQALALGVKGFILKEADSHYLIDAMHRVCKGERVIDPELALMALDDNNPLSEKERKALKLAGDGLKTQDIARQLFLSDGTVRNYLSEAISKLNATNRIDAARIAQRKGWL
ncbi:response regulator transcription factor [Alteromonas ponticola]|uniref:Response regulator transcription factor n=1 Tax=Alteromonas ponticola TaxID=2720613 RepID=A0ABX1R512_9ALTE|nr:response regulator transcription factor [Alteromonas ponticola]NMH61518.1 response regulator transcription factor [Alteromonas ponticola]